MMGRTLLVPFLLALLVFAGGCERSTKKRMLPEKPPKAVQLEFTGPEEGWPPRPKGRENVAEVPWREIRGSLTDALEAEIRQAALQDTRVRELLGERFAYISTDEIEPSKDRSHDASEPLATRVTFFSHSNNVAVEVLMQGPKVESVKRREMYQPPEGREEIELAVALARRDGRLLEKVAGMRGDAIIIFPEKDQPGYGHRILYVSFSKEDDDVPFYSAVVDLTEKQVLLAGSAAGR